MVIWAKIFAFLPFLFLGSNKNNCTNKHLKKISLFFNLAKGFPMVYLISQFLNSFL
jgi:hypothetical protein